MRDAFVKKMVEISKRDDFLFMTGDLGFGALEPLRDARPDRFLNMGISEQAMVSAAAGACLNAGGKQFVPWVYSIAPFLYSRAHEQVRLDVAVNNLPVKLVGNGGGFGYGVMGPTHHALEDYGSLLALRNMTCFVPAFSSDIGPVVDRMLGLDGPSYLRLGRDEGWKIWQRETAYAPWRKLRWGTNGVLLVVGPLVHSLMKELDKPQWEGKGPAVWLLSEASYWPALPPREFLVDVSDNYLETAEEHCFYSGLGHLVVGMLAHNQVPFRLGALHTSKPSFSGKEGSQQWNRQQHMLTPEYILGAWR